jgi:ribosome-associated protein YbcJ (S4-like RNA binding protein)
MYHNTRPLVEEEPVGIRVVGISRWPIALSKILKFERRVGSGGAAKAMVSAGQVLFNGKVETQTRKKWPVIR